jgi:SMI1-KNR4 cell-wall
MNNHIFANLSLEKNPQYVDELEIKYSIKLPPIFKAFVQTFEFGKFNPSPQHLIIHPNKDLGYDGFEHSLERKITIYNEAGEYFQTPKMFPIATSGIYGGGFCVGLEGDFIDKICVNFETIENKFEVIAPNILQFIAELKEVHWDTV